MAMISEHEQVTASPQDAAQDQNPQNQDIVKKVNELLTRAKRHRKRFDVEWRSNYEFVMSGKQWSIDRPRWRFQEVVNVTWSTIMTELAIQTDARPKFEFTAQDLSDEAFVDTLEQVNDRCWEKFHWSSVVQECLLDCKLYHVAHAIVEWNPELSSGLGDIDYRSLDPFYCYWDPVATDVNKGIPARYFIYAKPTPTSQLKLKYKEFEDKIKPDVADLTDKGSSTLGAVGNSTATYDPYALTRLPSAAASTGEMFGGEPQTILIRAWMRDDTLEELCEEKDEIDPESGEKQKEYVLKKKYPKGRYIEMANNTLLRDSAPGVEMNGEWIEYEDDAFPIARLVNYAYPREYAGENEVTHSKGPQKISNYIWSYILDMFKMQSNPVTVLGDGANVDEESITNEPGNIIHATDVSQVRREPGTPITPGSFDLFTTAQGLFDKVQGLQDVARGVEMPSVGSNIMLEGYLEASQTRPRMKNRNLDFFLQDCGELAVKRMMQFYTQPRVFRITNKEGYPEQIEFYIPEINADGYKVAKITRIQTTPDGGMIPNPQQEMIVKGMPDVKVSSGSALPYAKAQKSATATQLFTNQAIDREELLKAINWPNYETVLQRMNDADAQKARAEQQQAAP